jgi:type I restriction enzyme, S subunit
MKIRKSALKPGDVVIVRTGKPGSATIIPDSLPEANCSDLVIIRPSSNLDRYFLIYYLNSVAVRQINSRLVGAVQQHFNIGAARELKIYCPPVKEQRKITAALICLDRKISNLRQQNETLEKIAQTLFKHWFVDFEFPNEDGKPYKSSGGEMVRSELGEIPVGWRVVKLGDVVETNARSIGRDYKYELIEYVDIASVNIGKLEGTSPYHFKDAPNRARRLVLHGDVIWSGVRPNRKSYLFISQPLENLVVSTGFITLTPKLIPSSYLYSWVTTDSFVDYLTFNASGSAYPAVKAEHFEIAEVLLPEKQILDEFHAVIAPMRGKIHQSTRVCKIVCVKGQTRN